jgi:fermentation-respiration switch protein FrsA (DUF1100 family)
VVTLEEPVSFFSNGLRLAGVVHRPSATAEPRPAIVVSGGFGGVKELRLPEICRGLASAGFLALRFDYQGFGESEGERWRLIPYEQAQNIRDAVTFLRTRADVDDGRIAAYGNGWGGAPAIWATWLEDDIRCLVLTATPGSGERWLRSQRSPGAWASFLERLSVDRAARVSSGRSEAVPSDEIMVPDKRTDHEHRQSDTKLVWRPRLPLESAEAVIDYDAAPFLTQLGGRPVLFIHCERDALVPLDESRRNFELASGPKDLLILDGAEHHDIYYPPWKDVAMAAAVDWLRKYLA